MAVTIRPAVASDAEALHALHTSSVRGLCSASYSPDQIEGWLSGRTAAIYAPIIDRGDMFVAEDDGILVGFGEAVPGEIRAIYVAPAAARCGVGTRLMAHVLPIAARNHSGPIRLRASLNAVRFYEQFGFVEVEHLPFVRGTVTLDTVAMVRASQ